MTRSEEFGALLRRDIPTDHHYETDHANAMSRFLKNYQASASHRSQDGDTTIETLIVFDDRSMGIIQGRYSTGVIEYHECPEPAELSTDNPWQMIIFNRMAAYQQQGAGLLQVN